MISQNNKKGWRNPWFIGMMGVVVTALLVNFRMIWYGLHRRSTFGGSRVQYQGSQVRYRNDR